MGTNGDNLKRIKVSFRLAVELVHKCEREANTLQLPLSHNLRDRFLNKSSSSSTFDISSTYFPNKAFVGSVGFFDGSKNKYVNLEEREVVYEF